MARLSQERRIVNEHPASGVIPPSQSATSFYDQALLVHQIAMMNQPNEKAGDDSSSLEPEKKPVAWKPLTRLQRRVLGVLVEKAKTTPDAYPMTLNSITTGCNQKSNRSPLMDLEPHQVEDVLTELRGLGVCFEIFSSGRVPKYRHAIYEWMGVNGPESAVMTELLLRGAQTVGELRARAARMDSHISDLSVLQPIIKGLIEKGLVIALTPEGRGQIVSHNLYQPEELAKVRSEAQRRDSGESESKDAETAVTSGSRNQAATNELASQLAELRSQLQTAFDRISRLEKSLGVGDD